jgi:uncharacterized membrane protein YfhO
MDFSSALLSPKVSSRFLDQPWIEGGAAPSLRTAMSPPKPLNVVRDSPDRVTLSVPASSETTLALLADTDFPGWQATLDGSPIPIHRADGVYRAVLVPASAGPHVLDFRFRPETFVLGFYVTGLTVAFLGAYCTVLLTRGKKT